MGDIRNHRSGDDSACAAADAELIDAKDGLVYNASLTGFQEGFRLGLRLGLALPPPEDLQL